MASVSKSSAASLTEDFLNMVEENVAGFKRHLIASDSEGNLLPSD